MTSTDAVPRSKVLPPFFLSLFRAPDELTPLNAERRMPKNKWCEETGRLSRDKGGYGSVMNERRGVNKGLRGGLEL